MPRHLLRILVALAAAAPALAAAAAGPGFGTRPWSLDGQMVFLRMETPETEAVGAIAQDPQGFVWFGTQTALLRWDGYRMHSYARNPEVPGSLTDNYIRTLLVDEKGRLWVGTNAGGLSRYDSATDTFTSYPIGAGGTRDASVNALISDGHAGLWIGTGKGLDHLDGANEKIVPVDESFPHVPVAALLQDHDGQLWAATRRGLYRRGRGEAAFVPFTLPTPDGMVPAVRALHEDPSGRLWIGTELYGVYLLEAGMERPRRLQDGPAGRVLAETIATIAGIDKNEVWLGTAESGIVRVNTVTWKTLREQRDLSHSRSLPSNVIDALFSDRSGTLWVGTRGALARVDPHQRAVQTFYGGTGPGLLLEDEAVSSLLALPDGRLWVALGGGGVQVIDPIAGRVARLHPDPENPEHALPKNQVINMARTPQGDILLGTAAGLYRASADARSVERLQVPHLPRSLDVRVLLPVDDVLWLGGVDGLRQVRMLPGGGLELINQWDHQLPDPRVRTLARGKAGAIWIGTPSSVVRLDPLKGELTPLANDPRNPAALPGGYISAMLTDQKGRLWVATFGRGIQVEQGVGADGRPTFHRLTQADGLPQNSVDAMLQDTEGNIWASTDAGLARIDTEKLTARGLRAEQGVGIDGFFTGEADVTPAGDLVFAGLNGMVVVHPERYAPSGDTPAIVVTDIHVGDRLVSPGQSLQHEGIQLESDERNLTVEFAALDYTDPDARHFGYRLAGFDRNWLETPASRRLATYTNLPPGDYSLQLRTAGTDGKWSTPFELPVHVRPAWYQYAGVQALAALGLLSLVFGLVHTRTVVLRRRQLELEKLVAERTAELRRSQEYLEKMAYFDSLTGLPNRRMFNDHLRRTIASHQRGQGDFAVLLIDLDGFKKVNDTFGHDVGDGLLVAVATHLRALVRDTDLAARLGGDEFGVILAQPRDPESINMICNRIVRKLRAPIGVGDNCVVVGASIGIAVIPEDGATPDELYKIADNALYDAKNAGRNTWRWGNEPSAPITGGPRHVSELPA